MSSQLSNSFGARCSGAEWAVLARRSGPLPSVKALQETYDVGRDTALRAVDILREEGLVFTVKRRGTYVTHDGAAQ